jgi:hypothetical protein
MQGGAGGDEGWTNVREQGVFSDQAPQPGLTRRISHHKGRPVVKVAQPQPQPMSQSKGRLLRLGPGNSCRIPGGRVKGKRDSR